MAWIKLSLGARAKDTDALEEALLELGAQAVTLTDAADEPVLEPAPGTTPLWSETRVTGLFPGDVSTTELTRALSERLGLGTRPAVHIELMEDQDWVRAWMAHYRPMRFGRRLWICPSGRTLQSDADSVVVRLDPGLAFGTGTHPSTALCLRWLDGLDLRRRTVIDYGCGSGVLAVAAALLGAEQVWAVDIDAQAETATRANAVRNGVAGRVHVGNPASVSAQQAEILVANILAGPLIALAPHLHDLLVDGGRLALAGILDRQSQDVADAYQPYFQLDAAEHQDGWVRLGGRRRSGT